MQNSSLKSNIMRVLSANFLVAAVGFIGSFIFPRILSIDSYAQYHTFTLYVSYITILHLGFPSGMVVNYAGKDVNDLDKNRLKTESLITFFILLFFSIVFTVIALVSKSEILFYIAIVILPFCSVGSYRSLLQAWSQFKTYSRISMVLSVSVPLLALTIYLVSGSLSGQQYILSYLFVYWVAFVWMLFQVFRILKGSHCTKFLSKENLDTEKTGIVMVLGSYINTLFTSVDKQFVNSVFSTSDFAYYSFGLSLQSLMTVFITSIAQPLFPAMAQGRWEDKEYNSIKELLFIFGTLSGCAYFAASIIVKAFIPKYVDSLEVIVVYFLVFPAMAVVNCIYVNLYKIKKKTATYTKTLIGLLLLAVVLDTIAVRVLNNYIGIAIATVIIYYIWLVVGAFQFKFIKIKLRDVLYLLLFVAVFLIFVNCISNDFVGFFAYFIVIALLDLVFYGKNLKKYISFYKK